MRVTMQLSGTIYINVPDEWDVEKGHQIIRKQLLELEQRTNIGPCRMHLEAFPPTPETIGVQQACDILSGGRAPKMVSVLRDWVMELPLREQGALICAARNPDDLPKNPKDSPCRQLTAAIRFAFMNPADIREVDSEPGCFMSRKVPNHTEFRVSSIAHHSFHWVQKMYCAVQVLAERHPHNETRMQWLALYLSICNQIHVNPEPAESFFMRMVEDRIATGNVVS